MSHCPCVRWTGNICINLGCTSTQSVLFLDNRFDLIKASSLLMIKCVPSAQAWSFHYIGQSPMSQTSKQLQNSHSKCSNTHWICTEWRRGIPYYAVPYLDYLGLHADKLQVQWTPGSCSPKHQIGALPEGIITYFNQYQWINLILFKQSAQYLTHKYKKSILQVQNTAPSVTTP